MRPSRTGPCVSPWTVRCGAGPGGGQPLPRKTRRLSWEVLGEISTQVSRSGLRVSKPQANRVEDQPTFVSSPASPLSRGLAVMKKQRQAQLCLPAGCTLVIRCEAAMGRNMTVYGNLSGGAVFRVPLGNRLET